MFEHLDDPLMSGPEPVGLEDARARGRVLPRSPTLDARRRRDAFVVLVGGASLAWTTDEHRQVNVGDDGTSTTTTEPLSHATWVEKVDEAGGYRISFPAEPTQLDVTAEISTRLGSVDTHSFAAQDSDGVSYEIRWFDVPEDAATDPAPLMQELAEYRHDSGPRDLSDLTATTSFGYPAAEFETATPGFDASEADVVRNYMIVRGTRVYWMTSTAHAAAGNGRTRFIAGFAFVHDETTTTTTQPTTDEPSTTTTTTPTATPTGEWPGPRVPMPETFPAGEYVDPAGRFSTSLPTVGYSRYFFAPTWLGGPSLHDYWIASDTGEYLDELRTQDYADGTITDADVVPRRLGKYWCVNLMVGSFGSAPVTTAEKGLPAVRFRCDHPVNGATSYSWGTVIVDGDRVYWLNTSGFAEQPAQHRVWIDLLQILD